MKETQSLKPIIGLAIAFVLAIAIGIWVGTSLESNKKDKQPENPVLENIVQKLTDVLVHVEHKYVDDTDLKTLSEATISELLQQLDPHSAYITAQELVEKDTALEGIGLEFVMQSDTAYVVAPISGGPAAQAGIKAGDKIIKIDGEPIAGQGLKDIEILETLRGPQGTKVKLSVKRKKHEALLDLTITRENIPFHSVNVSYMVEQQVGYIKVSRFTANTLKEFKTAFNSLQKQGMTKLLLDLRGNPVGYMDIAIEMADHMLEQGQLLVYTKGKRSKYNTKHYAKGGASFEHYPVIVLIDEGTASAAEVVAGALQDNDRALIVGRRSFGKGLVQTPIQLHDGTQLQLTVARYYTPSGRLIQNPHGAGAVDKYSGLIDRYKQGEYFRADNIQFDEALKYQTSQGRTVYGGGGIIPDYFVPLDVQQDTAYLDQLQAVVKAHASDYTDQHREALTTMEREHYAQKFEVSELMLKKLAAQAEEAGIPYDDKAFRAAKSHLKLLLKAQIAANIWKEQGFYPIYHQNDEILQKALQLFDEAEALLQQPVDEEA